MSDFCYSCCAPLKDPQFKGPAEDYCQYCTDEKGNLKSKDTVQIGIAQWLQTWQPNLDDATAVKRAEHYMKAMPAWSEQGL
ncbi:MAG: hypothetical protein GY703_23540 [Gammaproteobacteria bacterium]|nr:hypothetical protein [Gammaproteobacteria bacterium]